MDQTSESQPVEKAVSIAEHQIVLSDPVLIRSLPLRGQVVSSSNSSAGEKLVRVESIPVARREMAHEPRRIARRSIDLAQQSHVDLLSLGCATTLHHSAVIMSSVHADISPRPDPHVIQKSEIPDYSIIAPTLIKRRKVTATLSTGRDQLSSIIAKHVSSICPRHSSLSNVTRTRDNSVSCVVSSGPTNTNKKRKSTDTVFIAPLAPSCSSIETLSLSGFTSDEKHRVAFMNGALGNRFQYNNFVLLFI